MITFLDLVDNEPLGIESLSDLYIGAWLVHHSDDFQGKESDGIEAHEKALDALAVAISALAQVGIPDEIDREALFTKYWIQQYRSVLGCSQEDALEALESDKCPKATRDIVVRCAQSLGYKSGRETLAFYEYCKGKTA